MSLCDARCRTFLYAQDASDSYTSHASPIHADYSDKHDATDDDSEPNCPL